MMAGPGKRDDLVLGLTEASPARTITEADVIAFAGLSGDFNALHTDQTYAAKTVFGQRVVHGLLGLAVASGLFTRTALSMSLQPLLIAMLGVEVRFRAPIFFGDTLHIRATITALEPASASDQQVVTVERLLLNQTDNTVQEITTPMLLKRVT
jgi:3-hydroxybutyryl-CoA dehydratase